MIDIKGFKWYIIILSVLVILLEVIAYSYISELDAYILFIFIIAKVVLAVMFLLGCVATITTKNRGLIPVLGIAVLSFAIVSSHLVEHLFKEEEKPVYLSKYCNQFIHPLSLKLNDDSTFEYNTGTYLEKEVYHGVYELSCDSLKLVFNDIIPEEFKYELEEKQKEMMEIVDEVKKAHLKVSLNSSKEKKKK